ncbi:hypothetical protein AAFF_G00384010 [Aldrovandia affinis]|uniref:Uncharacterized protein n=1 Tax=Aldrovandia affinis TaxID=143900 RepID=A0AAD7SFR3_9TELE|nr:hypothetical protein AAFF_G00384010 [Aldrovandia affinis]
MTLARPNLRSELHGVPHHQRFLIVTYNLHSRLTDGTCWHASCLSKVQAPPGPGLSVPNAAVLPATQFDAPSPSCPARSQWLLLPRPVRTHTRPEYLHDFVTEYHS